MRRWWLVSLLFCATAAEANPLDEFGFGAKGVALGGAATAIADDFSATYYNPAGLALSEHLRLELGYIFNKPTLRINGGDLDVDDSNGVQGGIVVPGRIFDRRVAFSLGLHLPDSRLSRVRALPQSQPRFVLYDNRPQRVVISVAAAVEVIDDLFVGAGLTFLSNTRGGLDITGLANATSVARTRLLSAVDVDLEAVRYPNFGALYTVAERLRFGLSYREEFDLALDLTVRVAGTVTLGEEELVLVENGQFLLSALNTNLFSPRQLVFGFAYLGDAFVVSADVSWLQWSRFRAPASAIDITLDLGDLDFEIPPPDQPLDPNFKDIVVVRVGAEYVLVDRQAFAFVLRAGYFFEPTPAPPQPGLTNYVDSDRHGISVGMGIEIDVWPEVLPEPLVIDLAGRAIVLTARDYEKADPADPVGDFRADGRFVGAAVTTRLLF